MTQFNVFVQKASPSYIHEAIDHELIEKQREMPVVGEVHEFQNVNEALDQVPDLFLFAEDGDHVVLKNTKNDAHYRFIVNRGDHTFRLDRDYVEGQTEMVLDFADFEEARSEVLKDFGK